MMYKIQTLNNISVSGLERLPRETYEIASEIQNPDAVIVRSFKMHGMAIPESLKAIGRAGAGVNNIPVEKMSEIGVPVFNAPGANANAVKELVVAGMLMASRNICHGWDFARQLSGSDGDIHKNVESGKKDFVGSELPGKTLGVIGLGAIGIRVANVALKLGMKVVGYDPQITVQGAWKLSSDVQQAISIDEVLAHADIVSFHVPLLESTKHLINKDRIKIMKKSAIIINCAREGIVDDLAICDALDEGSLYAYVCDYANNILLSNKKVITLPHIGASTGEAEDNCAIMVAEQIKDFLENGNIKNSVNFPDVKMPRTEGYRVAIANTNVPNMVGQVSTVMANQGLNIVDLINKSRGDVAYTLADVDKEIPQSVINEIMGIDGILNVRVL